MKKVNEFEHWLETTEAKKIINTFPAIPDEVWRKIFYTSKVEYYLDWLKKNEPQAVMTIKYVEDFLDTLTDDVVELFYVED